MSLRCIVSGISICFFLINGILRAQPFDTQGFYRHLKDEGLLLEQIAFANKLINYPFGAQPGKDTLLVDLSAAYLKLRVPDSSAAVLKRISLDAVLPEKKEQQFVSSLLLAGQYDEAMYKAGMMKRSDFSCDIQTSLSVLQRGKFKKDSVSTNFSPFALDLRKRYEAAPRYSAFLAGTFSAVVPGAGKLYIGYKRQALTAFLANVMMAAQAYECYSKAGLKSPQFIITASLFTIFYSGNIWGSVQGAKKKKHDYLKELDHEILDHYNTELVELSR